MVFERVLLIIFSHYVVIGHQRNFADIGGNDIHGLRQSSGMAAYGIPNEFRSLFNRGSEMIDSGGWFTVKDIIRPYADDQKFLVQFPECFGVVVYPFEQNRLVTNIDTTGKQVEYGLCGFFRISLG